MIRQPLHGVVHGKSGGVIHVTLTDLEHECFHLRYDAQ